MYQGPVVGVGAAGRDAAEIRALLASLPTGLRAPLVVVQSAAGAADWSGDAASRALRPACDGDLLSEGVAYLVPPGVQPELRDGRLRLQADCCDRAAPCAGIDGLFRSMADSAHEQAVAVLLGDAADCIEGLKAVRAGGGLTLVATSEAGAASSVAEIERLVGMGDLRLPVGEMGQTIERYLERSTGAERATDDELMAGLDGILHALRQHSGHDFRPYKPNTLLRRLERRMRLLRLESVAAYLQRLESDPVEPHQLAADLLITVTRFFREPEVWEQMRQRIIPAIVAATRPGEVIRAWVPGCSTGEEAYGLAMLIDQELERRQQRSQVLIFASDIAAAARERASKGLYPTAIAKDLPPSLLKRYFSPEGGGYRISPQLRDMVLFSDHDLLSDPPFSRLQLISCRNLLIYFKPEVQQAVLRMFHFALEQGGYLVLGAAESLGDEEALFIPASKQHRIFRRRARSRRSRLELPSAAARLRDRALEAYSAAAPPAQPATLDQVVEHALAVAHAPPSALVDATGRLLYVHGDTSGILRPPPGEPTLDLLPMLDAALREPVRGLLGEVALHRRSATLELSAPSIGRRVLVSAQPLPDAAADTEESQPNVLVGFRLLDERPEAANAASVAGEGSALQVLEQELEATRGELQQARAALAEADQRHRVQSEEILSINEELQSANEELETSKEELQSLNEELAAVNARLEGKIEELEVATDDLVNLLAASQIATVFLDQSLQLKRFTPAAFTLLALSLGDVGRRFPEVGGELAASGLEDEARRVLKRLLPSSTELTIGDGRSFLRQIHPYRSDEHGVGGVVVTFTDISEIRNAHAEAVRAMAEAEARGSELHELIMRVPACIARHHGPEHVFVLRNQLHEETFGRQPCIGRSLAEALPGVVEQGLVALYDQVYASGQPLAFDQLPVTLQLDGRAVERWLTLIIKPMLAADGRVEGVMTLAHDVTDRVQARRQLEALGRERERELAETKAILEAMTEAVIITDGSGRVQFNRAAREMYGLSQDDCLDGSFAAFAERFQVIDGDGRLIPMEGWAAARAMGGESAGQLEAWIHDTRTGRKWFTSTGGAVVHDADGAIRCSILCIRDITCEREARQRLYERNQDLSNFASVASHDLQAPLRLVYGYLELLRQSALERLNGQEQHYVDQVLTATARMRQMIDGLLGYARLSVDAKITVQPVSADDALRIALDHLAPQIAERSAEIQVEQPLPQVLCKTSLLVQAFQNLVGNAIKYCHGRPLIRIRGEIVEPGRCRLSVSDNGPGIPAEHVEDIFDVFNRLDHSGSGCGIGLAFCRRMATISGGRIWVESGPDGGASFHLELPGLPLVVQVEHAEVEV